MKFKYFFLFSMLFAIILAGSYTQILAQHEMVVEWQDGGNLIYNALYDAVMGDTLSNGDRADLERVYILRQGGFYWNYSSIENDFPLHIEGEEPGTGPDQHPAVIQMVRDPNTLANPGKMISCSNSLTLKNLYIIGSDELGVQTYYQPIEVNAIEKRFIIDNCVFERSNFSIIAWAGGRDNDIFITNCHYRNLIETPPTQQWAGRGNSIWTDADTVIVENNTYFNVNMVALQIENGAANYVRFNHNTLVNIGRSITSTANVWWLEAYFTNLLLVNVFWHGEGLCDYGPTFAPNRDPRAYNTGLFPIATMPSRYGTDVGRRIGFANSAAYLDNYFSSRYADTVRTQPFINAITDSFFTTFDQMVIRDTTWLNASPNFTVNPNTTDQYEAMYNHITASRGYQFYGSGVQAEEYFWGLDETDPWTIPVWPLPENFTYDNADLMTMGTDGLPLGDLNWFPTQKENFEANKAQYVADIEGIPGGRIIEEIVWEDEAEAGTLDGDATTVPFTGDAWYTVVGGSSIEWTFDVAAAGAVDMVIKASINNGNRGENDNVGFNFFLNGSEIHDALGWGEFVFWGGDASNPNKWNTLGDGQFHEVLYTQADIAEAGALQLQAGENTVMIEAQWNVASFAGFDFYEAGTQNLVASLIPADAVNNDATPGGEGTWVPRGFNSVALGSGGSTSFNVDLANTGNYKVRIFYQNAGTSQTGSIQIDGTDAASFTFDSDPDSGGLNGISDIFEIPAGTHTLSLSGGGVNLDWAQLIQETVSSVKRIDVPEGFVLSQNYPNPFNPKTNINFSIGQASNVNLTIYNILGQKVTTLINDYMNAGTYTVDFDASHLASGVYLYRIEAGDFKVSKKMMLLK